MKQQALFALAFIVLVGITTAQDSSDAQKKSYSPKYTPENLRSLATQDLIRWMTILEDLIAEYMAHDLLDGVLDKKSVKIGLRYILKKFQKWASLHGMDIPAGFPPVMTVSSWTTNQ